MAAVHDLNSKDYKAGRPTVLLSYIPCNQAIVAGYQI